jgi:hypothetical protein
MFLCKHFVERRSLQCSMLPKEYVVCSSFCEIGTSV